MYNNLLECGLSGLCNNASLVLRKMSELECGTWPPQFEERNMNALRQAATDTLSFTKEPWTVQKWRDNRPRKVTVLDGITLVRACVSPASNGVFKLDLRKASKAWLNVAVVLEAILGNMQQSKNRGQDINASDQDAERDLLTAFKRLTLSSGQN